MAVYRFKISLEENEDIFRDIDIRASQSFLDFHLIIQSAFKFDAKHAASFFVCDDYWRKGQEITLNQADLPLEEEEIRKKVAPKKLMADTRIAKHIEHPHQRFIYVFDPNVRWTFLVEMIKIVSENATATYPLIFRSGGLAPRQYKLVKPAREITDADALPAIKEEEPDEENIYKSLHPVEESFEEDDLKGLDGEEGDEKSEEMEAGDEESDEESGVGHFDDEEEEK